MTDIKVRDMYLGPVTKSQVFDFTDRWHYSGHDGSAQYKYGLYHDGILYGVITYNLPTRDVQDSIFGPEHWRSVVHMGRLCMSDEAPHNSESRLISLSLKALEKDHPHIGAVVTYAATDAGHIGYVYQATNALYTGMGGDSAYYCAADGTRRSTKGANGWVSPDKARAKGWTVHKALPKHRYMYILGNRTQRKERLAMLRYEILPYPKGGPEIGHTTRERDPQYKQPIFDFENLGEDEV